MGAAEFRRDFEAGDIDAVVAGFAPGFRVYHAGQTEATADPSVLQVMFPALREVLGDRFHFSDCVSAAAHGEQFMLLPWTAVIGGIEAEGVDLIREDDRGRLLELRFAMRPIAAIHALSEEMQSRLGAFHAPRPPDSGDH